MKEQIIEIIKGLVGNEFLYFSTELEIKLTPHSWPVLIWGVCVSPANEIYLMDASQEWFKLDENDDKVLHTLYQRMQSINLTYKTAI